MFIKVATEVCLVELNWKQAKLECKVSECKEGYDINSQCIVSLH